MRFERILLVLSLGLAGLVAGCETAAPYATCPLDKEVTDKGICKGTAGSTSCVVRKHPQCELAICLSYYGTEAVCSQPCSSDAQCPDENGSKSECWTFAPADASTGKAAERYCVPPSRKALMTN